ncbi:MAG TPA: type IV pilus modification protein PilV [Oleiagrimonas sp.]|nr:type IV pilus modification protein PilV [Oleiagrimonas sp.]
MRASANPKFSSGRHQRGVGLIEVLIAVLIVSIGFLGVAALQAYSLSTNNSAMARSMATVATYSILDAMRADRDNALSGSYNTTVTAGSCVKANATLASDQLYQWCELLSGYLGDAATTTGTVNCVQASGNCTVTIVFDDSRSTGDTDLKSHKIVTKAAI